MSTSTIAPPNPPRTGYFLPEHARQQLLGVIEHLAFLARAVGSRPADDERIAPLQCRPEQLAWYLTLLARQIAPVLAELEGPAAVTVH